MLILKGVDDVKSRVGQELGVSDWLEVTQEAIDQFADATGDHQFIHVDVEKAKQTPFGGTIAHGYFTLSLVPRFAYEMYTIENVAFALNYGANRVRFPAPLKVGSRVRMRAHAESAAAVVEALKDAPGVSDVRWPGFSGMVSFRHPDAIGIAERTKLFTLAESLGGVESLVEVPQAMTHQSVEGSAAAVPADLVRLSCGIEAPQDLAADVLAALRAGDQTDRV
jgi:acyl dehydratase